MPSHIMPTTWLPTSICNKLDQMNRSFLWASDSNTRKVHPIKWGTVTKTKGEGGLDIREARKVNVSFPAKVAYCFVATESAGRQLPIAFLDHVKDDFKKRYGGGEASIAVPNSLKKEFGYKLKEHMQYCVDHPKEISKLAKVKAQVSEVKGVMLENIEKVHKFLAFHLHLSTFFLFCLFKPFFLLLIVLMFKLVLDRGDKLKCSSTKLIIYDHMLVSEIEYIIFFLCC
ncbi:hypothetical protein BUALT_Bualt12G0099500 [Buddleja alternifolia]|uniref:Longin domain-containing protein n=1 Tax=Buddleja alternifolia TaxID=168488 RepID=A0AAV6WYI8_9LAMI|nr:hypothetical protein BUALT_Bualt12G0099500 [Buddleja alternifolia]